MKSPSFSVIIPIRNAERHAEYCFSALRAQTNKDFEVFVFDNNSTDRTQKILAEQQALFKKNNVPFSIIASPVNYYVGGALNRTFKKTRGQFILLLCSDVILEKDFLKNAITAFKKNSHLGALQPKVLQCSIDNNFENSKLPLQIQNEVATAKSDLSKKSDEKIENSLIDTCGFQFFRSRRIINIGHGEIDRGQYTTETHIFGVEGACPVYRREALSSIIPDDDSIPEVWDNDMQWYGDDFDCAWRLNLAGWEQKLFPECVAWHDRKTTKKLSRGFFDFISHRRSIPSLKRVLDYRNTRLSLLKNESVRYWCMQLPWFLKREIPLLLSLLFFEPTVFLRSIMGIIRFAPRILRKRKFLLSTTKQTTIDTLYRHRISP